MRNFRKDLFLGQTKDDEDVFLTIRHRKEEDRLYMLQIIDPVSDDFASWTTDDPKHLKLVTNPFPEFTEELLWQISLIWKKSRNRILGEVFEPSLRKEILIWIKRLPKPRRLNPYQGYITI